MKQTAVEWLVEELKSRSIDLSKWNNDLLEKAKEMEKQQIIKAVDYCLASVKISNDKTMFTATTAEQYYNETFKA